jgi:hypothetical protein
MLTLVIVRIRWVVHVARMAQKWHAYVVLVENPKKYSNSGCESNIKLDLKEIGWE